MMETASDVKLEPESNSNDVLYTSQPLPSELQYPDVLNDADVMVNFITFRTNVEQTSQLLNDSWVQLHTLLDSYKSQLFSVDNTSYQNPSPDDLMKALLEKERENSNLHDKLKRLCDKYNMDIIEKEGKIQELQIEVLNEKNEKNQLSSQEITRLKSRIRVLEGKLEKSHPLKSSSSTTTSNRWSNRPSRRMMSGKALVERRTPTPTQVARVTPVATPDKLPDISTQACTQPQPCSVKIELETEMDSDSSKTDSVTPTVSEQCQGQKFVLNVGEAAHGAIQQKSLPPWTFGSAVETTVDPTSSQSLFLCPHCTQSFNNEQALDHHLRASHRKFICPKCYEHYTKKYDLLNHIGLVHGKKTKVDVGLENAAEKYPAGD